MHRFHLPPEQCAGPTLTLTDREAHHGLRVLRLRRGERAVVLDGAGGEMDCEVAELRQDAIELQVTARKLVPPLPCQITLLQAIPKGRLLEDIIQKATELGVARIVPLLTARVVMQLDGKKSADRTDQWRTVAREAIKQCGSTWLPTIDPPMTPAAFLARGEQFDLSLIGSLREGSRHPRAWFTAFQAEHQRPPRSIGVWVGPEGDFTDAEIAAAQAAGARPITLGRLVLRCETAAMYCLSVLNYEMQSIHASE